MKDCGSPYHADGVVGVEVVRCGATLHPRWGRHRRRQGGGEVNVSSCDDCNRSTSGHCWRHNQFITIPVADPTPKALTSREQRREFTRLLEEMQCAWCDGPAHEGECFTFTKEEGNDD